MGLEFAGGKMESTLGLNNKAVAMEKRVFQSQRSTAMNESDGVSLGQKWCMRGKTKYSSRSFQRHQCS